jgi:pilus assembly protein CpaB
MPDLHALARQVRRALARFRRPLSALLAGVAVLAVIETLAPAAPPSRDVVVAAHDISAGVVLSAADVRMVAMPPSVVPKAASSSTAAVLGRVVAGPVRAGEAFTDRRVLGRSLLAGYPRGLVAAPVRLRDAAVVGLLVVGDRIDVYAARRDTTVADRIVAGVRIVALPRPPADNQEGALVVLAVTPSEAAALAQASATAPLSLTLLR